FKDISPLLADGAAFRRVVDAVVAAQGPAGFDVVAGIEARGFVLAAAVAYAAGTGVVPVRKEGKLPRATHSASYTLEYGRAVLEVHQDAFEPGQRVMVVVAVVASGGAGAAAVALISRAGGVVGAVTVRLELSFRGGRKRLAGQPLHARLVV